MTTIFLCILCFAVGFFVGGKNHSIAENLRKLLKGVRNKFMSLVRRGDSK